MHPSALSCAEIVELRGLEPRRFSAEMQPEVLRLVLPVVTQVLGVLRICLGVLRDVTVLTAARDRRQPHGS